MNPDEYDNPEARQAVIDHLRSMTPEQLRQARDATMNWLSEGDDV